MALVFADRVLETCSSPGTGAATLLGAPVGYQTFLASVGDGNTCYYAISDQTGANWEVGVGTYTTATNAITRGVILSSSNGGALVNFASGTQNVFLTYPAEKAVSTDTLALQYSSPPPIGNVTPDSGAFTTLSASSTVSGAGFTNYFASPPAIGSTSPSTGAFTTLSATSTISGLGFATWLANGFASPSTIGSTAPNSGAFTTLSASSTISGTGFSTWLAANLASPTAIGNSIANTGAFTTLSASSTVSGTGFSTYLASPPSIGSTAANTGAFTTLSATGAVTNNTTSNNQSYTNTGSATITIASGGVGSIDNMTVGGTTPAAGTFTTLSATGGSIDNTTVGGTTPAAGTFTSLSATSRSGALSASGYATAVTTIAATTTYTTGGITLPAQVLAAGSSWRVRAYGTYTAVSSATARSAQIACFWGSSQLTALTGMAVLVSTAQTTNFQCDFEINSTSTTAAWMTGQCLNRFASATALALSAITPASVTGLTAGAQTIDIRFSMSAAIAGDSWNIQSVVIERIQ